MTTRQYKTLLNKDERDILLQCYGKYIEARDLLKDWVEGERREKIKIYNKLNNV